MTELKTLKCSHYNFYLHKFLSHELTKVYGIGFVLAQKIVLHMGFKKSVKVSELNSVDLSNLENFLNNQTFKLKDKTYNIHNVLKTFIKLTIANYKKANSYIGSRWKYNLAVHGQRTRSTGRVHKKLVLVKK